ncbi:unnamed protein product [marine sediment metagenome]|uniref:Uncharacterized protein n=1 Tax=marine sediment metagenome TaxID=412755 RepID=X0W516_9ZZZZ
MSSSINNAEIDFSRLTNTRTTTLTIDLAVSRERIFDLTKVEFGNLDFDPDFVILKYIAFSSQNANPGNLLPILTCDFIQGKEVLAPYLPRTSIQSFNVRHKVNFKYNKQYAKIESKVIGQDQQDLSFNQGTVLIALEWIRYARDYEF